MPKRLGVSWSVQPLCVLRKSHSWPEALIKQCSLMGHSSRDTWPGGEWCLWLWAKGTQHQGAEVAKPLDFRLSWPGLSVQGGHSAFSVSTGPDSGSLACHTMTMLASRSTEHGGLHLLKCFLSRVSSPRFPLAGARSPALVLGWRPFPVCVNSTEPSIPESWALLLLALQLPGPLTSYILDC